MQDYMDGIAGATLTDSFPSSYVYRGTDEGILLRDDKTITVHLGTSPRYHRK
jgi:putative subtilisin carlsberg